MSDRTAIEWCDPAGTLLREVAEPEMTMKELAVTYRACLSSRDPVDWPRVNAAIIGRWGLKGLVRVKRLAWKDVR